MKLTLLQSNLLLGDFKQAVSKLAKAVAQAQVSDSKMVITSELFLGGYPPKDLLFEPSFWMSLKKAFEEIKQLSKQYSDIAIVVGSPYRVKPNLYNAVFVFLNGELVFRQNKTLLPNYDVFDEARYFVPATSHKLWSFKGKKWGFVICEDAWDGVVKKYGVNPVEELVHQGADILVNLSASPFEMGKAAVRHELFSKLAKQHKCPIVMVNQVGFQDELIFDGGSFAYDKEGNLSSQALFFEEDTMDVTVFDKTSESSLFPPRFSSDIESCYHALVLGIRDYVQKSGFQHVVLGLSGGIDSAVTAALAVDALGAFRVTGILMPSPYSSWGSISDAQDLAKNLNLKTHSLPIKSIFEPFLEVLGQIDRGSDLLPVVSENLQARIRGTLLMGHANHTNALVLSTGNKSELSVGYCTQYGDMNGALAVLGDVYKTKVYELANFMNADKVRIPVNSIQKPPSAELKPNQKDQDTLPDYAVLDGILTLLVEERAAVSDCIKAGYDASIVNWIETKLKQNEYKRKQAAMIIRVTSKAFGSGRRLPILKV